MKLSASPLLLAALAVAIPLAAQQPDFKIDKATRSIAITATARVTNEADVATVHIGFLAYGPDKDTAYANGSRTSNAIIDALHQAGVPKDAIESDAQQIEPTQDYLLQKLSSSEKAARAFSLTQSWSVRSNAADAAKILDLAVKAGANNSGNIDWSLRDPNAAAEAAATTALQRARSQAASMAASLSVKLGSLLYASNQVDAEPVRPVMPMMGMMGKVDKNAAPLAISTRQIETSATVYAVFAIE